MSDWKSDVADKMSGGEKQPAKVIDRIETRKGKSGGFVHTHHHKHPDVHPSETHVSGSDKEMLAHMAASMGQNAPASGDPGDTGEGAPDPSAGAAPTGAGMPVAQ